MSHLPSSPITTPSYFQLRMAAIGATPENIRVLTVNPEAEFPIPKNVEIDIFTEDIEGNIEIHYYGIDRVKTAHYSDAKTPFLRFYTVIRLRKPDGDKKYKMPSGKGVFPFFPPPLLEKYDRGEKIETLLITEGAFKSFAAQLSGFDSVGLSSITHYADSDKTDGQKIHLDISLLMKKCQVEKIVILWDSDCRNISEKEIDLRAERRPLGFYQAAKKVRELALKVNDQVKVVFAHIVNENLPGKGLDDLLLEARKAGISNEVIVNDLMNGQGQYFYTKDITDRPEKLHSYFCLDSAENFYGLHKEVLKDQPFSFWREMYQSAEDGILKKLNSSGEEQEAFFKFYHVKNDQGKMEVVINFFKHVELLKKLNFRRYDKDGGFFTVKIVENVVNEVSTPEIIDVYENYIHEYPGKLPDGISKEYLIGKLYGGLSTYFSTNILGRMRTDKPIRFNEHSKTSAFFYYLNGYVEVTAKGTELKPYSTLTHCIWANQIIQRDFNPVAPEKYTDFSWFKFMQNIANQFSIHPYYGRKNERTDPARLEALKSVMGYLLHSYFETDLKAVILTDSKIGEGDEANGRSGKTLLIKGLGHVLNKDQVSKTYVEISGKDFDPKSNFKYQELGLDTRLFHLNDAKRNLNIEDLFNDITEGIRREKKNESPSMIRSKIVISTNRTIRIRGASARGRCLEFELAEYYDPDWTPEREFGRRFFDEWGPEDWQQFDNCILDCVVTYLKKGVIQPDALNLNERKKVEETSREFVAWMESKEEVFKDGEEFDKRELFDDFKGRFPDWGQMKQRQFTYWLKTYCQYDSSYHPITPNDERPSNGKSLIIFWRIQKQKENVEDMPF